MRTYITILIIILIAGAVIGAWRFLSEGFNLPLDGIKAVGWKILGIFILLPLSIIAGAVVLGLLLIPIVTALLVYPLMIMFDFRTRDEKIWGVCIAFFSLIAAIISLSFTWGVEDFCLPANHLSFPEILYHEWYLFTYGILQALSMLAGGLIGFGVGVPIAMLYSYIVSFFHKRKERQSPSLSCKYGYVKKKAEGEEETAEEDKKWFIPFLKNLDR